MRLLKFGNRYRKSRWWVLRWAAELCLAFEKRWANREEKKLKRHTSQNLDREIAEKMLKEIKKKMDEKEGF